VVDNRPGAGTVIGSELVAHSAADGYTLLFTANPHTSNPALVPRLPYDTARDFAPLTMIASAPLVVVAHPSVPVNTIHELIAYAKVPANHLAYASSGNGGPQHLAGELFKYMAGVAILHVPYKGSAPALTDVLGGQVPLAFSSLLPGLPHIKAGKLRALGLTGSKRLDLIPEVPTVAEAGLPGFEYLTWYGVFAPGATPRTLVARIQADMARMLTLPEVKERLARDGVQGVGSTPGEFDAFVKNEIEKVTRVVRMAGIKTD
jgi:tripartite-type tricarboxylate transporter receptor subunit TctC